MEKYLKSHHDLDLDQKMSNIKLSRPFQYTAVCSSLKLIDPLLFGSSCTQTNTLTDRQENRQLCVLYSHS